MHKTNIITFTHQFKGNLNAQNKIKDDFKGYYYPMNPKKPKFQIDTVPNHHPN